MANDPENSLDPNRTQLHEVNSKTISLRYAIEMCKKDGIARRLFYRPSPTAENPRRMMWMLRPAETRTLPMSTLYCIITGLGDVLHSYDHILHRFVGRQEDPFCKLCRMCKGDRIHVGLPVSNIAEFLRLPRNGETLLELPVDQPYGPCHAPETASR